MMKSTCESKCFFKCKMQNAECKIIGAKPIIMLPQTKSNAKPYLPNPRGQGTRPRPVGDAGSVSWRSGQRNRASEQREDFFGYHKRAGTKIFDFGGG